MLFFVDDNANDLCGLECTRNKTRRIGSPGNDIDSFADVVSWTFIVLGDRNRAFDLLTRAELARAPALIWAKVDPVFDSVRADPRFTDLLRTLKLARTLPSNRSCNC